MTSETCATCRYLETGYGKYCRLHPGAVYGPISLSKSDLKLFKCNNYVASSGQSCCDCIFYDRDYPRQCHSAENMKIDENRYVQLKEVSPDMSACEYFMNTV